MIDIASTFRSYALSQDGSQRPPDEVIPVRVSLLLDAAAEIERSKAALREIWLYSLELYAIEVANGALSGDKQ
jgi:hypothetical protein